MPQLGGAPGDPEIADVRTKLVPGGTTEVAIFLETQLVPFQTNIFLDETQAVPFQIFGVKYDVFPQEEPFQYLIDDI
jgi:hypothetical protein